MSDVTRKQGSGAADRAREMESQRQDAVLRPPADIFEHADGITVLLDMPGVSRDRLNIESDRNTLLVEGEVKIDMPQDTESLYADVRSTRFRRSFSLSGEQLDTEQVNASLTNGVLRINIPKRAELKPKKIEVKTG